MNERRCQLCCGRGYRLVVMDIIEKCGQCDGAGYIAWPTEWRPHEQMKREDDGYDECVHMMWGVEGSCARCEGT